MFPKKLTKTWRRIIYTFISIAFIFIILQFTGIPIIKNYVKKTIFEKSGKIYSLDFDKFKINWFTGKILITDITLNADTALFLHSQTKSEFLFKFKIDTFIIKRINPRALVRKGTFLKIKDVSLVNPQLSVYKKIKKDSLILLDNKNINYDTVKNDVFSSFLDTYKGLKIREFTIKNGNINFLKPGTSKANLFSIGSITYKLSDFELTKEKFFRKDKGLLAQNFELFIDDYHLAMKDNVHQLSAKKIYLNSKNGKIYLKNVKFEPVSEEKQDKVPNLMYFSLDSISLSNVNIKDFLKNKRLRLSHGIIDGFSANIKSNKNYKTIKKKIVLDKDTIISKVDIYKYLKPFLTDIQIDTIEVRHCAMKKYNSYSSQSPQISIAEFDADIFDFLLDSTSFADTSRLAFAKDIETRIYGMQYFTKDTSHLINVDYLVFSTAHKGLLLKNVSIKPVLKYQGHSFDKIVNFNLSSVNISGFDFKRYFHFNEIKIKNIDIPFLDANYKVYNKKIKSKNKNETRKILKDFANIFFIENLNIKQGNIDYSSNISDKKTAVNSAFYANFNKINIDFSKNKITQIATVNRADIKFNRIKFRTSDSLYNIKVDSAVYSSALSYVDIYNLSVIPNDSIVSFLKKKNKSMTVTFKLPFFEIDKNNFINALEKDSLGLSTVTLQDATIDLKLYPAIAAKKSKKTKVDSLKKIAIKNIMTYYDIVKMLNYSNFPQFDSSSLIKYKLQTSFLDTICKVSIKNVLNLKVKQNQISLKDTSLWIIDSIFNTFVTYSKNVDKIKDSADFEIYSDKCISKIKYLKNSFEASKIDLNTIFNTLSLYLARINVDTFTMTNTKLNVLKFEKENYENVFNTMMNVRILGFKFDTTSEFKKFLFSENVIFDLQDIKSSRENYAFRTDLLHFSSADSVVRLQNCSLNLKSENKKILDFYANSISLTGIDLVKVIIDSMINVKDLDLQNSRINYYPEKQSRKKNKKVITTVFLPKAFKIANLNNINLKNLDVKVFDSTMSEFVSFNTDIHLKNFFIDSVTYPMKNKYFLPVDNINFDIRNLIFRNHDTTSVIQAKSASYNSIGQKFLLSGFDFKTFKKDSSGKSNLKIHFSLDTFSFENLNYENIRFNNKLIIKKLTTKKPELFFTKNKSKNKEKFNIKNIDLYDKIKKYFRLVNIEDFDVENIAVYQKNDSLKRIDTINDISIKIKGFYVDSTAKIDTPRLLYADDIRLKIRDKKIFLDSDSIYSLSFENLNLSMNSGYVQISGIEIKPGIPLNKVQKYYKYRTTAFSGKISNLAIRDINWKKLIFDNYFETKLIFIDTADIATYVDLNAPHNSSRIAKHLIEPVFALPIPISVDLLKIMNFNVVYYELSAKNHQTAYISLNQGKINISNLTNDSSLIAESKPYTKISVSGKVNDVAPVKIDVVYMLSNRGDIAQITGSFGKCQADIFNTYLYNGANLTLDDGQIDSIYFTFTTYDSLAVGKFVMKYKHLKTSLIKSDTLNRKKMKFVSWIVNTLVVRRNNPRFGPVPKVAGIAYIHDRSYGDLKMWVKAILSGVQATVAFKPKDARRINKIRRKNSYLNKYFTD